MKRTVTITDEAGMHARPASKVAAKAGEYDNEITLSYQGRSVNLKSVMALMSLGIPQGGEVTVSVDGDDAEDVLNAIIDTLAEQGLIDG